MGFSEQITSCGYIPQPNFNHGYDPSVLLESFVCSVWCGATKFIHTELTRSDRALSQIFGWERVPAQDVYKRFFNKFMQADNLHAYVAEDMRITAARLTQLRRETHQPAEQVADEVVSKAGQPPFFYYAAIRFGLE